MRAGEAKSRAAQCLIHHDGEIASRGNPSLFCEVQWYSNGWGTAPNPAPPQRRPFRTLESILLHRAILQFSPASCNPPLHQAQSCSCNMEGKESRYVSQASRDTRPGAERSTTVGCNGRAYPASLSIPFPCAPYNEKDR